MDTRQIKGSSLVKNTRGQFVVEAVLLMTMGIGLLIWGAQFMRENQWVSKMVAGPWNKVSGMLESGVWEEPDTARAKHPNQIMRHRTPYPRR